MASSSSAVKDSVILTEDDIPGASLAGRNPSSLKNEVMRFFPLFLLLLTELAHVDPPSDSVTLLLVSSIVNTSGVLIRGEHNTDMACTKTPIQQFL